MKRKHLLLKKIPGGGGYTYALGAGIIPPERVQDVISGTAALVNSKQGPVLQSVVEMAQHAVDESAVKDRATSDIFAEIERRLGGLQFNSTKRR